jgi:hypothetical protein
MRARVLFAMLAISAFAGSCGGDRGAGRASATPWTTTVDSTADTIRVRTTGPVPDSLVHRLVPELRVGAEDGTPEETFGSVELVFGTRERGLLVYDAQAEEARLFDSTGAFVRRIGAKGGGPGEHGNLNGITQLPDGDWVFWDAPGARLNRYAHDGEFRSSVRLPITGWFLSDGLRSDAAGRLYAWALLERDSVSGEFLTAGYLQLDSTGAARDTVVFPKLAPEPPQLKAQTPDGGSSTIWGLPWAGGNESALTPDGGLISGFGVDYVLYSLPAAGRPLRIEREHAAVPVSDVERSEMRSQLTQRMKRLDPSWTWTGPDIPSAKPAYRDFRVDLDGRIWVRLYTPGEPIPQDELPEPRPGPNPPVIRTTREPNLYDVFSADGRYLGRVRPPGKASVLQASGNTAWGIDRDASDVSYAVRFRIDPALPR